MSIVRLFDWDVSDIIAALPQFDEAWAEERWRRTAPFSPHKDSDAIFLRRQPGSRPRDVMHQLASVATRHLACGPLALLIDAAVAHVEGRPARAMLVKLLPGGRITEHTDEGIYASSTERLHIPITTNDGCWFAFGDQRFHLSVGGIYAFDKHVPHSGANEGDTDRVHLIVDVVPDSPAVFAG